MSAARRNPLTGRQPAIVLALAIAAGIGAAVAGLRPTGSTPVDVVLVAIAAAAVTWAAATAPWWAVAAICGVSAAFSFDRILIAVGLVGAAIAFFIGAQRRNLPWGRALAALLAVQVFCRMGHVGFLGFTALIGCTACAALFVIGVRRRPREVRKVAYRSIAVITGLAAVAVAGLAIASLSARAPLTEASRQAQSGLQLLNDGDFAGATKAFELAEQAFDDASGDLSAPWGQPGRLLPMVSQNRRAVVDLADQGAAAMRIASNALGQVDPEALRVNGGRIDLEAIRALQQPFADVARAVDNIRAALADTDSQWLVGPLRTRLNDLNLDVERYAPRADNALLAVQVAPALLGGEGPRHYFIMFTTPAEARGGGGFMGNYAEITIDKGLISLSAFGRTSDLSNGGADPEHKVVTGPPDFLERWGRFGFLASDGTTAATEWSLINMPPDFPTTAQVVAELYPQSGGRPIDGVFMMDPQALAAIVSITGPIQVDGVAEPLNEDNLAEFIIRDQYEITQSDERIDLLNVIAQEVVKELLGGSLPPPNELAQLFGPLSQDGHLTAWSKVPAEQALFEAVHMSGSFPKLGGSDGIAVTVDNFAGNKIDAYSTVSVEYEASILADGSTNGTATITLTNSAPSSGLPLYVIGDGIERPSGTNYAYVSLYSALPVSTARLNGETVGVQFDEVFGWHVASLFVEVASASSATFELEVAGVVSDPYHVQTRIQPSDPESQFAFHLK